MIGGMLSVEALAILSGRDRHRPQDHATLRAAAVEMARSGLKTRDIASALGLTAAAVRQLLGERATAFEQPAAEPAVYGQGASHD